MLWSAAAGHRFAEAWLDTPDSLGRQSDRSPLVRGTAEAPSRPGPERRRAVALHTDTMLLTILIDILILLAVGVPILVLYRRWHAWVERDPHHVRPVRGTKRFGFRSWAARGFVLDTPIEHVKKLIDGLPEMQYAEAAAIVSVRGRTGNFMALAPLAGKQVFETGIETEWIAPDTVDLRAHSYADWPLNALDNAELPLKQYQMTLEHAVLQVEPHGERQTRVSYELETPGWAYMLSVAIILLIGWVAWLVWRTLRPVTDFETLNLAVMAVLTTLVLTRVTEVLRLQSIGLMDSIVRTFGPPVRQK